MKKAAVSEILDRLGFAARHSGTEMLRCAVEFAAANPGARTTKEVYPAVARMRQVTPAAVERNIRHAIECAYGNNREAWRSVCGWTRPTNTEVILRIARAVYEN